MSQTSDLPVTTSDNETKLKRLAVSIEEAAYMSGLSRSLLYDVMKNGELKFIKRGRRRLVLIRELERYLGIEHDV